jgi:hypothetical protein
MALSITPTAAWDFTLGNPAGLSSVLGAASTLTLNGGTLNSSGHLGSANAHYMIADPPASAICTNPLTLILCVTVPSDIASGSVFVGLRDEVNDRWAFALQAVENGGPFYGINVNGSQGGRLSSQSVSSATEAVIVAHIASGGAKLWYNGTQVLTGTGATITHDTAGYIRFNNLGTNSGTTLKYAALYDAEPSGADITALGSNAASAYTAIFGGASSVSRAVFPFFLGR